MKKVLVASGTSANKKKFAVETITEICTAKGYEVEVEAQNIYDINIQEVEANVIVIIGPNKLKTEVPTVSGMSFITKIGIEKTVDEIIAKLG